MTRRAWISLSVALILLIATAATFANLRESHDDLAFLKPYEAQRRTAYVKVGPPLQRDTTYVRNYSVTIKEISLEDTIKIVSNQCGKSNGWSVSPWVPLGTPGYFASRVMSGTRETVSVSSDGPGNTAKVYFSHELSTREVWIVRILNLGHDPFEPAKM